MTAIRPAMVLVDCEKQSPSEVNANTAKVRTCSVLKMQSLLPLLGGVIVSSDARSLF